MWVLAPPRSARDLIPESQLTEGDLSQATQHVRAGGWAVLSQAIAAQHKLHIGDSFVLPAPRPTRFRLAAISTNIGWPSGAVVLNADDFARAWDSSEPTAYQLMLVRGASPLRVRAAVARILGAQSGFTVETTQQRVARHRAASRQGLARLTQIAILVLIAAVLAMSAAMGGMIWQRRVRLAQLKVDGVGDGELWRAMLLESALLLGAGSTAGAAFGLYGQLLLSRALSTVTGFPVVYEPATTIALVSLLAVTAVAVAIVALPGRLASRVQPAVALQE